MVVQIKVFQDEDGAWCASGMDYGIHTQGETLEVLFANIEEATQLHFADDLAGGRTIDLLIVRERHLAGVCASPHQRVC